MQLSARLEAVASLTKGSKCLADVGCDHGYIPIYLILQDKIQKAIAMDINKGPLLRAQEHIRQYGLEDKIETRLSNGVSALKEGEADTVVVAGMGGALTIRILTEGDQVLKGVSALVLQPQSEIESVRRFLQEKDYAIVEEKMVKDEGKYYPMMRVLHGKQEPWTPEEYRYGKWLMEEKSPVFLEYLAKEERTYRKILEEIKRAGADPAREADVQENLQMVAQLLQSIESFRPILGVDDVVI